MYSLYALSWNFAIFHMHECSGGEQSGRRTITDRGGGGGTASSV
jgi:hypothetical protein